MNHRQLLRGLVYNFYMAVASLRHARIRHGAEDSAIDSYQACFCPSWLISAMTARLFACIR